MDAFDAVREVAATLHGRVVARGSDALSPVALAEGAVDVLDLELVRLQPGDVALKGARALFDEQSGSILCEQTADAVEGALLVAHEIGHTQVHAGSASCTERDIDPSRTTESAPVGLQRVEDYGARERRELQANVFAREFLLPRNLAKQLHLDGKLGAKDIATRTGLPIALVRQQLLDALLLPGVTAAAPAPPARPRDDPDQDRAAAHRGSPFVLQAGPGTGKTSTLVKRIVSLLREGVDPASILVLTFSNRAAGELSERVSAVEPEHAPRIWMGTFHAFGLDLVRRYHDRLGLPADPSLFDRSDAIEGLEEVLPTLPLVHYQNLWDPTLILRDIVGAISRAKDEMVSPARYLELAEAMATKATDDQERKAAAKCREVGQIYEVYEKMLADQGGVDFGDLILRATVLLENDAAVRTTLRIRHRHVLVDEYQDVNHASVRLLKALAGDGRRLWVVGDARQSIYRFRGASSRNVVEFATDFPGANADRLKVNYRSTGQVTELLNAIAPRMSASNGMLKLELVADRGNGPGMPEVRRQAKPDVENAGVAAAIRELQASGVEFRDQAVLCRTNSRLSDIARTLESLGIPTLHLGSLFERDEVRDLLAILSLVIDPYGDALVRVGAMERYAVPLQDVHEACRHLRQAWLRSPTGLATVSAMPGLSAAGASGLARIATDLGDIENSSTPWDALATYLLDRTDLGRRLAAGTSVPERMRAIAVWQLLNFIRDPGPFRSGLPIRRALDRVRQLVLLNEERDLRHVPAAALQMNAVRLMTVHGSKGLEFEAVHVPGLTVASFPLADRGERCPPPDGMVPELPAGDNDPEEECLFFVACSRARTHLQLHLSQLQSNGNNRKPSPFLDWLPPGLVGQLAPPATFPPPGTPRLCRSRSTRSSW
jgi:superfamily I DNA/RNA helicase